MSELTQAQTDWLAAHPQYCMCGRPRPGISFKECGTLYADGHFEPMAPMKVIHLKEGCRLIGIPSDLYLTDPPPRGSGRAEVSELTPRRMVKLQAKLNSIFVRKRDACEPIASIYAQLQRVERWLNCHRVFW